MKCPYCGYEHGWNGGEMETKKGEHGDFFNLSNNVEMRRSHDYRPDETRTVMGCPACNNIFMGD